MTSHTQPPAGCPPASPAEFIQRVAYDRFGSLKEGPMGAAPSTIANGQLTLAQRDLQEAHDQPTSRYALGQPELSW